MTSVRLGSDEYGYGYNYIYSTQLDSTWIFKIPLVPQKRLKNHDTARQIAATAYKAGERYRCFPS